MKVIWGAAVSLKAFGCKLQETQPMEAQKRLSATSHFTLPLTFSHPGSRVSNDIVKA